MRDKCIALLCTRLADGERGTLKTIEVDTGLSRAWLLHLAQGKFTHPGVNNIECLLEYLTGKPIVF